MMLPRDNGDDATDLNLIPSDGSRPIETAAVTSTSSLKGTSKGTLGVGSGTELRAVMAVLRGTWGLDEQAGEPAERRARDRARPLGPAFQIRPGQCHRPVGDGCRAGSPGTEGPTRHRQ